jgi:hypothetical protein
VGGGCEWEGLEGSGRLATNLNRVEGLSVVSCSGKNLNWLAQKDSSARVIPIPSQTILYQMKLMYQDETLQVGARSWY